MTKVDLDALRSQAESFGHVASAVGESLGAVNVAVGEVTGIGLSGAAATAAASSAASKVKPLYKIASNVFKTVGNAISKLPDEYVAQVDGKSWSSEELEQKIQECETHIKSFESIEKKGKKEHASKGAKSAAKGAAKEIKAYEKKKEHYEKILRKLESFDVASAAFFGGIPVIIAPVMSFCSAIGKGYDSKSNKFTLPSKSKSEEWENSVVVTASKYGIDFMNGLKESHEKADQFVKHVMGKEDFSRAFKGKINKFKDKAWHAGRKLFGDTGKGENINTKELSGFKKATDFMEHHPVAKKTGKALGRLGDVIDLMDFGDEVKKEGLKKAVIKKTESIAVQTSLQDVGSAVGAGIGTCIGGPVGTVVGEAIGGAAGSIAGSIISDKFIDKE